jgi:phage terminase large subunit-like protein
VQKDKIEYDEWIQQGFVETTPGDMIDYSFIRKKVNELNHQYHIQELAYDPWDAQMFKTELDHDGVKVVECRQGYRTLSGPTKDFLAMIPARKIEHYGNPVL